MSRVIVLALAFTFSTAFAESDNSRNAKPWIEVLAKSVKPAPVLILAEHHDQTSLSRVVNQAVRNSFFRVADCLFVELSVDLQPTLDRFAQKGQTEELAAAIFDSQQSTMKKVWQRIFAHNPKVLAQTDEIFKRPSPSQLPQILAKSPFDSELVEWTKGGQGRIFAYDLPLQHPDREKAHYFQTLSAVDSRRFNQIGNIIEYFDVIDRRNQFMAEQISEKFEQGLCHQAVVVVGADHELNAEEVSARVVSDAPFSSLSENLKIKKIKSVTLIVASPSPEQSKNKSIRFERPGEEEKELFANPIGVLR